MSQIADAYLAAYLTVDESLTCMFPDVVLQFLEIQEQKAVNITINYNYKSHTHKHIQIIQGNFFTIYMAQYKYGDAGVPDGIMNSTVYVKSQTSWRTLSLED